ncbi:MAG TPA: Smr/MutS family protein [Bryobacteraceae bacterium]|nr:Smr/MutS family protein [Bryobacteraceae bacterium]
MSGDEPIQIPITGTLDLHAFAPRDVKDAVEAYLEEAHRLGLTALRIIHGRGIGVQREAVHAILNRTEYVLRFTDAPAEAGGWGATLVTLTRPTADPNARRTQLR